MMTISFLVPRKGGGGVVSITPFQQINGQNKSKATASSPRSIILCAAGLKIMFTTSDGKLMYS